MSTRTYNSLNDNGYEFEKNELHKVEYSTLKEIEEEHKFNKKLMNVADEGDRILHPVEYSTYNEDQPLVTLVYQYPDEPKKIEYSTYMEDEGERCPIKHEANKIDQSKIQEYIKNS